jgi:hypothetical protein
MICRITYWISPSWQPLKFFAGLSFFVSLIIFVNLWVGLYFETNDDVGMMMIAHGFGLSAAPSPTLLFSNALEGLAVEAIGEPFGFTGYGIYLTASLAAALAYIYSALSRINGSPWTTMAVIVALSIRPIFAPQFTIIAGVLAVAAVIALLGAQMGRSIVDLSACAAFSIMAFCMRAEMCLLIVLLALPFLLRAPTNADRRTALVAAAISMVFVILWMINRQFYQSPGWAAFKEMNFSRALFTDFGFADRVLNDKTLLAQAGLTPLDIRLVADWWFLGIPGFKLDKLIMSSAVSFLSFNPKNLTEWLGLFTNYQTISASSLALITLLTLPRRRLLRPVLSVLILIVASLVIVAAGRVDVSRVVFPGIFFIAAMSLIYLRPGRTVLIAAEVLLFLSTAHFAERAGATAAVEQIASADLDRLDQLRIHVVWGADLPYEALYRPLERRQDMPRLRLYGLGVSELAPFALAYWGGSPAGPIEALSSPAGWDIFARPEKEIALLRLFCEERLGGRLSISDVLATRYFTHQHALCQLQ